MASEQREQSDNLGCALAKTRENIFFVVIIIITENMQRRKRNNLYDLKPRSLPGARLFSNKMHSLYAQNHRRGIYYKCVLINELVDTQPRF